MQPAWHCTACQLCIACLQRCCAYRMLCCSVFVRVILSLSCCVAAGATVLHLRCLPLASTVWCTLFVKISPSCFKGKTQHSMFFGGPCDSHLHNETEHFDFLECVHVCSPTKATSPTWDGPARQCRCTLGRLKCLPAAKGISDAKGNDLVRSW